MKLNDILNSMKNGTLELPEGFDNDVFLVRYNADHVYMVALATDFSSLLEEYCAVEKAISIFMTGSDDLIHSIAREYLDCIGSILERAICRRVIDIFNVGK